VRAAHAAKGTDVFSLADSLAARIRAGIGFGDGALRRIADVSSSARRAGGDFALVGANAGNSGSRMRNNAG